MRFLIAVFVAVPLLAQDQLFLHTSMTTLVEPGASFRVEVSIRNSSQAEARHVVVRITGEGIAAWGSVPSFCSEEGLTVSCAVGNIGPYVSPAYPFVTLKLEALALDDPAPGGAITITASAEGAGGIRGTDRKTARTIRVLTVTSAAAMGPGSLYDTLLAAQDRCGNFGCRISFRIPPGNDRWVTIRPTLQLPRYAAQSSTARHRPRRSATRIRPARRSRSTAPSPARA